MTRNDSSSRYSSIKNRDNDYEHIIYPPHLIHNILLSILLIGLSALTLLSCSEDSLTGSQDMQPPSTSGNVMTTAELDGSLLFNSQTHSEKDPQQNHKNFMEMLSTVESMERQEIEDVTDEQLLELGKPVLDITENTVQLSPKLLLSINNQLSALNLNMRELNEAQLESIKRRFQMALRENPNERPEIRTIKAKDIRRMLLDFYDATHSHSLVANTESLDGSSLTRTGTLCESMYNQVGTTVYLYPGDNLNTVSYICGRGLTFFLTRGYYFQQEINNTKSGDTWVGSGATTVLDGMNSTEQAFSGSYLRANSISHLTVQNYTEHGIHSTSSNSVGINIHHVTFKNFAPSKNGKYNSAVNFDNCQNIEVRDTNFQNVSSGVLFTDCFGPLRVNNNEALNPGRNFFQCDKCEGEGIRVNRNSLEHTTGYGNAVLEDWINIYNSEGTSGDYIQVNDNRVRVLLNNGQATKVNDTGCMIMLGDYGGMYQEAKGNIGVNPGGCGLGVAGGTLIEIRDNKMYSQRVTGISNVGFQSRNYYPNNNSCEDINFIPGTNEANFNC